ncbi:MAG: MarR family transcriptional regulator [Nakamurella sp.]
MSTSQPVIETPASAPARRPPSLAIELRGAVLQLARRIRQERSDDAITLSQFAVLAVLDHHGPMTPRKLADHEQIQPPSMTRTLTALADKGYVAKRQHPTDRRQVLIELTEAGLGIVKETRHRRSAWLSRRLAKLEPEQRATLAEAARIFAIMNAAQ